MARNGVGIYVPPAGQPVTSGTSISSATHNALIADLGNEITRSLSSDGQTPLTANFPAGGFHITGLGGINGGSLSAKGSILSGTGVANAQTSLPAGADGALVMADSSQAGGLNYGQRGSCLIVGTGALTQADGITAYMGAMAYGTAETVAFTRAPFTGKCIGLFAQCSNAGAGTRAYTLRISGVDTAVAASTSGASTQATDTAHVAHFAAGDVLSVRLVTSSGSTVAQHSVTLDLVKTSA